MTARPSAQTASLQLCRRLHRSLRDGFLTAKLRPRSVQSARMRASHASIAAPPGHMTAQTAPPSPRTTPRTLSNPGAPQRRSHISRAAAPEPSRTSAARSRPCSTPTARTSSEHAGALRTDSMRESARDSADSFTLPPPSGTTESGTSSLSCTQYQQNLCLYPRTNSGVPQRRSHVSRAAAREPSRASAARSQPCSARTARTSSSQGSPPSPPPLRSQGSP